jgi:3'(2'), 5'-bisphosphate nucleotidase
MNLPDLKTLIPAVENAAREAGAEIMKHYAGTTIYTKDDGSNVTDADHAAENIILPALASLTPSIPILSEERVEAGDIPDIGGGTFWTVDPLDGTHEFIKKSGAFAVAIALIHKGSPVLGVVHHPALDLLYSGYGPGTAAKNGIKIPPDTSTRQNPPRVLVSTPKKRVLVSTWRSDRAAIEQYLSRHAPYEIDVSVGPFRSCRVAEGLAEMSVAFSDRPGGRIAFWDVAPGHAIVEAAGGKVESLEGKPLVYDADNLQVGPYAAFSWGAGGY